MEKSKPTRNWRGYLKEYAIIVIGVLTALGAQQAAEEWREHRQYTEAREAVRKELNDNLSNLRRREAIKDCLPQRLEEIGALLDKAGSGQKFEPARSIPLANTLYTDTSAFSAASQAGRASLFPQDELRSYGRLYVSLQYIADYQEQQYAAWIHLKPLRGKSRLSPEMLLIFSTALEEARAAHFAIGLQIGHVMETAAPLGITGDVKRKPLLFNNMCTPISVESQGPA